MSEVARRLGPRGGRETGAFVHVLLVAAIVLLVITSLGGGRALAWQSAQFEFDGDNRETQWMAHMMGHVQAGEDSMAMCPMMKQMGGMKH